MICKLSASVLKSKKGRQKACQIRLVVPKGALSTLPEPFQHIGAVSLCTQLVGLPSPLHLYIIP